MKVSFKIIGLSTLFLLMELSAFYLGMFAIGVNLYVWKILLLLLSVSIALSPIFIIINKLKELWTLSLILGIVAPFLLCLMGLPFYIFKENHFIGSLVITLLFFTIVSYAVSCFIIYKSNFYVIKIILRRISISLLLISDLTMLIFASYNSMNFINTAGYFSWLNDNETYFSMVSLKLWFWLGIILLFGLKKYVFIKPQKGKILLYLRSFKFDKESKNESILKILDKNISKGFGYDVLRIGNPNTFGFGNTCNTYFLSTTHWQREVGELINKADSIFVVIKPTSGVLWEIYNHQEILEKFIFYVPRLDDLNDILANQNNLLPSDKINTPLTDILQYLSHQGNENHECYFYYLNGKWFYLLHNRFKRNERQIQHVFFTRNNENLSSLTEDKIFYNINGLTSVKDGGENQEYVIPFKAEDKPDFLIENLKATSQILKKRRYISENSITYYISFSSGDVCADITDCYGKVSIPLFIKYPGTDISLYVTSVSNNHIRRKCYGVNEVLLPPSITKIEANSFSSSCIVGIDLPVHLSTIESWAFNDCQELETIFIPDEIEKIEDHAFHGCRSLECISLPSIAVLNLKAFDSCWSKLNSIIIRQANFKNWDSIKLIDPSEFTHLHCTNLYVPENAYNEFINSNYKNIFGEIRVFHDTER